MAAYLEASHERTRRIYLRHGYTGYRTPIQLPGGLLVNGDHDAPDQSADGPRLYPMTRRPQLAGNPPGAAAVHRVSHQVRRHD